MVNEANERHCRSTATQMSQGAKKNLIATHTGTLNGAKFTSSYAIGVVMVCGEVARIAGRLERLAACWATWFANPLEIASRVACTYADGAN